MEKKLSTKEAIVVSQDCPKLLGSPVTWVVKGLNELELLKALKSVQNRKSPGKCRLTKEFYETFLKEKKILS